MKVSFKQIRNDKDITEKEGFGGIVISSIIMAIVLFYLPKLFEVSVLLLFAIVLVYIAFVGPQIRKLYSDWVRKDDIVGDVNFYADYIEINNSFQKDKILYNQLDSINFHYNYIQGKTFSYKDIIHNGLAELTLNTTDGNQLVFKFLIENKNQLWNLKPIWKNIYLSGIPIKEKMGNFGVKTIMFDGDLTDKRILELKKELNLESIYS